MLLLKVLEFVPTFVLVFFRTAGLMLSAPLFGSAQISKRVKVLMALVLAMSIVPAVKSPVALPDSTWGLAMGIGGELMFGLVMGLSLSLAFIAVNWAGDIIGQQMGLSLGGSYDPQYGRSASVVGELYFLLMLVVFLGINGHHAMLTGLRDSLNALPLLSVGIDRPLFGLLTGLLNASTALAIQMAAPVLLTMLVVDLSLGFVGKTMPQLNVMTAGLSMKSAIGVGVLILCMSLTSTTIQEAVVRSINEVVRGWRGGLEG